MFFFVWSLLQSFALIALYKDYHFVDPALYDRVKATGSKDVLDVAVQLGRFDLISMFLGTIALLIGVMAVSGFWMIRGAAIRAAEEAAKLEAKSQATLVSEKIAEDVARRYLEEKAPALVETVLKFQGIVRPAQVDLTKAEADQVTSDAVEIGGSNGND